TEPLWVEGHAAFTASSGTALPLRPSPRGPGRCGLAYSLYGFAAGGRSSCGVRGASFRAAPKGGSYEAVKLPLGAGRERAALLSSRACDSTDPATVGRCASAWRAWSRAPTSFVIAPFAARQAARVT